MNQRGIRKAIIRSSWAPVVLALGGLFGASRSGAEDIDNLTPQADLSILKDDGKTSVAPGTNDTYTVAVTNNGPSTITGATVSDVLPAGTAFVSATGGATYNPGTNTVNYTTGTLATGGTATFSLTLFISPMLSGTLTNTATVAPPSGATDPVPGNNASTDTDTLRFCGDGVISGGEECDDGNTTGGDGCSSSCTVEPGFQCSGEPSVCHSICATAFVGGGGMTLGGAAGFTVLVQQSPLCEGVVIGSPATRLVGDVGVCDGVDAVIEKATIDGDVVVDDGAGTVIVKSDVKFLNGHGVVTQDIETACNDKDTAATAADGLPCDITIGTINASQTINPSPGADGVTTVCVDSINLVKKVLGLNGPGPYVFRIAGGVVVNGSRLVLGNGLEPNQVLWYAKKIGVEVDLLKDTTVWSGTWLIPDGSFVMDHGVENGSILAGCTAKLSGGAILTCP